MGMSSDRGRVDSGSSNERGPKQSGTPKTGFSKAPSGEQKYGAPGEPVPGKGKGWGK